MQNVPAIFDRGQFVAPPDDFYKTLTEPQKQKLLAVAESADAATAAEAEAKAANDALTIAHREHNAAQVALDRVRPRLTQTDNARNFIKQSHEQNLRGR